MAVIRQIVLNMWILLLKTFDWCREVDLGFEEFFIILKMLLLLYSLKLASFICMTSQSLVVRDLREGWLRLLNIGHANLVVERRQIMRGLDLLWGMLQVSRRLMGKIFMLLGGKSIMLEDIVRSLHRFLILHLS